MAYDIRKTNNDAGAVVDDASLNTKFDITLIGKNFAGYGLAQNTNFLHLLENFSNDNAPSKAINGQLWYDNSDNRLRVNTGTAESKVWKTLGIIEEAAYDARPTLSSGNFWWDTTFKNLYCKLPAVNDFQLIGGSLEGIETALKPRTVKDEDSADHKIIEVVVNNDVVFIISSDEFTLHANNLIDGITDGVIKKGITAAGLTTTTNVTPNFKFWGSASNSDRLGGVEASEYISTTNPYFADNGLTIGNGTNKQLWIYNDVGVGGTNYPIIENKISDKIIFKTTVDNDTMVALQLIGNAIIPGDPGNSNIGDPDAKFNEVHAAAFKGIADGADTVKIGSEYVSADMNRTPGTVVVRTSETVELTKIDNYDLDTDTVTVNVPHTASGNVTFSIRNFDTGEIVSGLTATLVEGETTFTSTAITADLIGNEIIQTSTTGGEFGAKTLPNGSILANYFIGKSASSGGDVAEKYLADAEYEEGTVLMIGGEKEVTAAKYGNRALGALSINPSLSMNDDLTNGTLVGLKGRVPVKVIGSVKKGDHLIAADTGIATALKNPSDAWLIFAVSLETNDSESIKIVEAVIL